MNLAPSTLSLFRKYGITGPRYAVYPSIKEAWQICQEEKYISPLAIEECLGQNAVNLYVHLPFCHSLCSFCGLNIKVAKDSSLYANFALGLMAEIKRLPTNLQINSLHIGGGTPNYLSADQLNTLLHSLSGHFQMGKETYCSIEIDLRFLKEDFLQVLKEFSFTRLIVGIQDLDQEALRLNNRAFSLSQVFEKLHLIQKYEFEIDLEFIAGLPHQNIEKICKEFPHFIQQGITENLFDGVLIYPMNRPLGNPLFTQKDLDPIPAYLKMRESLINHNFKIIAPGHFVQQHSPLLVLKKQKKLGRSIHGLFPLKDSHDFPQVLGIGPSAISNTSFALWQNEKVAENYIWGQVKKNQNQHHFFYPKKTDDQFHEEFIGAAFTSGKLNFNLLKTDIGNQTMILELIQDKMINDGPEKNIFNITDLGTEFLGQIFQKIFCSTL